MSLKIFIIVVIIFFNIISNTYAINPLEPNKSKITIVDANIVEGNPELLKEQGQLIIEDILYYYEEESLVTLRDSTATEKVILKLPTSYINDADLHIGEFVNVLIKDDKTILEAVGETLMFLPEKHK
ncbi:MAG: hypothetical protein J0H68_07620 [Sphingobacteriia bacterium]|nr:hypothetical protein [Sphingobacteriia bacterium]